MIKELALKAGLVETEKDFEGNLQYIGTKKQWDLYEKLEEEYYNHDCHSSPEDGCEQCELDEIENKAQHEADSREDN